MWNTFLQAQQWESHTDTEAWSRGYVVTHPPTHLPTYLFWEHLWGAILDTCDLSDIWPEWWGDCIFSNCFFQTDRTNAWPTWFLQPQSFNVPAHLSFASLFLSRFLDVHPWKKHVEKKSIVVSWISAGSGALKAPEGGWLTLGYQPDLYWSKSWAHHKKLNGSPKESSIGRRTSKGTFEHSTAQLKCKQAPNLQTLHSYQKY